MNRKGFMTLGLIICLPVLFTLIFSFYWIVWFLNQKHKLDNICYNNLLMAQDHLVDGNNKLLQLNPQAQRLISEKRFWTQVMKTAPPKLRAAAYLRKKQIISQQVLLKTKQKIILQTAEFRSRQQMGRLRTEIQKHFHRIRYFWQARKTQSERIRPKWLKSQIQVDQRDIAPTYKRSLAHSQLQTLKISWSFPLAQITPQWMVRMASVQPIWQGLCESHPYNQGGKWQSSIGAGKASWKQLF